MNIRTIKRKNKKQETRSEGLRDHGTHLAHEAAELALPPGKHHERHVHKPRAHECRFALLLPIPILTIILTILVPIASSVLLVALTPHRRERSGVAAT